MSTYCLECPNQVPNYPALHTDMQLLRFQLWEFLTYFTLRERGQCQSRKGQRLAPEDLWVVSVLMLKILRHPCTVEAPLAQLQAPHFLHLANDIPATLCSGSPL